MEGSAVLENNVKDVEKYLADWRVWRDGWEQWLSRPFGWLSAVSMNWLDGTPRSYDGIPGLWWHEGGDVHIDPQGLEMTFGDEKFTTEKSFSLVGVDDEVRIVAGDVEVGITYRELYMIVGYEPDPPKRRGFKGVPTFDANPAWVLKGRFEPHAEVQSVTLDSVSWRRHKHDTPGVVRFEYGAEEHELLVLQGTAGMNTVFADATSGVTTYPLCRALNIEAPAADGTVTLDFNRAYNLPCAFSDFVPVCPAAPPRNRLPFAVEAGEKIPLEKEM